MRFLAKTVVQESDCWCLTWFHRRTWRRTKRYGWCRRCWNGYCIWTRISRPKHTSKNNPQETRRALEPFSSSTTSAWDLRSWVESSCTLDTLQNLKIGRKQGCIRCPHTYGTVVDTVYDIIRLHDSRRHLVQTLPQILGYSVEDNVKPKLAWLQDRLSLDVKSLNKLVQRRLPSVLIYSIEDNLEPKLAWLQKRLVLDAMRQVSALLCNG